MLLILEVAATNLRELGTLAELEHGAKVLVFGFMYFPQFGEQRGVVLAVELCGDVLDLTVLIE